jgi:hypothetical protein
MELNVYYSQQVRHSLGYFPVWEPGENVTPGDVGVLVNGVFEKRTDIRRILGLTPKRTRQNIGNPTRFYSQGCTVGKIQLNVSESNDPKSKALGSVMLQFSGEGGIVFDVTDAFADGLKIWSRFVRISIAIKRNGHPAMSSSVFCKARLDSVS